MFHLAAYRGFTIFNEAFPIDGIVTDFGKTVGTAVDPEINLGKVFIVHDFGTFLDTKIMLILALKLLERCLFWYPFCAILALRTHHFFD